MHYNLASRIRRVRNYRGLKQEAVAHDLNILQQAYSSIELGRDMRLSTLVKLCEVLRIDPAFLLSDKIVINDETLEDYDNLWLPDLMKETKKLRNMVEVYQAILQPRRA